MKSVGIVLIIFQILAYISAILSGTFADIFQYGLSYSIGFNLFGIIGIIFLVKSRKKGK